METKELKRILVVALDNLGDAVMASAIFPAIKKLAPQASIGFWVKEYVGDLFVGHPLIDIVHASDPFWDKSPGRSKGNFSKFKMVLDQIKDRNYETVFVLNAEWRRALACSWIKIPQRFGYARRKAGLFLTQAVPEPKSLQHFVDDHRQLVEIWANQGVSIDAAYPQLTLSQAEKDWGTAWRHEMNLRDKKYFVFHLFSGDDGKNWPMDSWVELVDSRLKENPLERVVLIIGAGEQEKLKPYWEKLNRPEVVLVQQPTLNELKSILASALLMVGGDSGLGHVAAALGTPVLSLFGITQPERSRPMGRDRVQVLRKVPLSALPVSMVKDNMDGLR